MTRHVLPRTVAVCIATHERAALLRLTLDGLRAQTHAPDEIVVSDSSAGDQAVELVREAALAMPGVRVRHLRSPRRALPWQRWWAARETSADVVLFLDDDVVLREDAIARLVAAYADAARESGSPVAGVGFVPLDDAAGDDGAELDAPPRAPDDAPTEVPPVRRAPGARGTVRERLLRTSSLEPGAVTAGGITIDHPSSRVGGLVPVRWLWGGGMSYPRDVLERVGQLELLGDLYERRLGKGEDAVLSTRAAAHGALFVLAEPLAEHLEPTTRTPRANAQTGWRRGLWGTWGRAHTMRWIAADARACRRDWSRLVVLETARSLSTVARAPWRGESWARLAGSVLGATRAVVFWNRIPSSPGTGRELAR